MPSKFDWDRAFKAVVAFAVLLASLAVAYYFFVFLPAQERTRLELQQKEQQAAELKVKEEKEKEVQVQADAASEAAANDGKRAKCLSQAQSAYNSDNAAFCREALAVMTIQYHQNECGTSNQVSESICAFIQAEIDSRNGGCELGGTKGDEIKKRYSAAKDGCYRVYPSK